MIVAIYSTHYKRHIHNKMNAIERFKTCHGLKAQYPISMLVAAHVDCGERIPIDSLAHKAGAISTKT